MPFYDTNAGVFRIYYLQDKRPNPEWTFHPVYAIETSDVVHYTAYFFYTGNKHKNHDEECRQVILCATSSDGIHWTKTDFYMDAKFEMGKQHPALLF